MVACSGGCDSLALAHALWQTGALMRVCHVHHGLQQAADAWALQVATWCHAHEIPYQLLTVQVGPGNMEAAARNARYTALLDQLQPHEILVLGHHQTDQAETVLLRLVKGAGVTGLKAMQPHAIRQGKRLWRPLLGLSRAQISEYANQYHLSYIHDPTNINTHFERGWLRQTLWPLLKTRWPGFETAIARGAVLLQDAHSILTDVQQQDLSLLSDGQRLNLTALQQLSPARQRLALSGWIQGQEIYAPPFELVNEVQHWAMLRPDAQPERLWQHWLLCKYQTHLYRLPYPLPVAEPQQVCLYPHAIWSLACGQFKVHSTGVNADTRPLAPVVLQLMPRQGGEYLHMLGHRGHWPLKKWLQQQQFAPWQREQIYLIYHPDEAQALGIMTERGLHLTVIGQTILALWQFERLS